MGPKRVAAVALFAVALTACGPKTTASSKTDCHDVANGHNCVTVTQTTGAGHYRVTETWAYKPDAPVVPGLPPVHRSEWVATIDCDTRDSQFEQARFWDAQDREITLNSSDNAEVRQTLTANAIPPLVSAICDSTS